MAEKLPQSFGKVVLTLDNCLLPKSKLEETPSQRDGLNREVEIDLRILGCELIQTAGILLKLRQVAMATGQMLFQRFYYAKSFVNYNMETTAMSCMYLASKIEETPRQILDVINVFNHIKQVRGQKIIAPMVLNQSYFALKTKIINAERRILKELGFCVYIKNPPHKLLLMYLKVLGLEENQKLVQCAWNYMNDLLRTDVFVRYRSETISCACIYLTARTLKVPLPNKPAWYEIFKVTESDIIDVSYRISELYRRTKPNAEKLEQAVEKLKNTYMEAKNKGCTVQTLPPQPPLITTANRISVCYNSLSGFISRVPANPKEKLSTTEKRSHLLSVAESPPSGESRTRKNRSRSPTPTKHSKMKSRNNSTSSSSSSQNKHKRWHRDSRYMDSYDKSDARPKSNYYSNGYRRSGKSDQERHKEDRTKYRPRNRDRSKHRSDSNDGYSSRSHKSGKCRYHSRERKG